MLLNAYQAANFHSYVALDSTHKVNIENFPFSVLGTITLQNQFRPIAFHISTTEETETFSCFLQNVKAALFDIFHFEWKVEFAMGDNCAALQAAFGTVLSGARILNCWFHLVLGMEKKKLSRAFGNDIFALHYAPDSNVAGAALKRFLEIWPKKNFEAFQSFQKGYLMEQNCSWMNTQSPAGVAKTNNPLERYNQRIKNLWGQRITRFQTLTKKLSDAGDWMSDESRTFARPFPASALAYNESTPPAVKTRIRAMMKRAERLLVRHRRKELLFALDQRENQMYVQSETVDVQWREQVDELLEEHKQQMEQDAREAKGEGPEVHDDEEEIELDAEEVQPEGVGVGVSGVSVGVSGAGVGVGGVGDAKEGRRVEGKWKGTVFYGKLPNVRPIFAKVAAHGVAVLSQIECLQYALADIQPAEKPVEYVFRRCFFWTVNNFFPYACTCPIYFLYQYCKHSFAIAMLNGDTAHLPQPLVPNPQRRKPARRRKYMWRQI